MPRHTKPPANDHDMIPPTPWGIESHDKFLRVCSLEDDGSFGEVVFYMNHDDQLGEHQPIEMARAKFIVQAVNSYGKRNDPSRPNVFRSTYLALKEILADDNKDPKEIARREWLKRRLDEEGRFIASIPTKFDTQRRR